jgi:hypothetical protein
MKTISLAFGIVAIVLLNGGCSTKNVLYDKDRKTVANVWEGNIAEGRGIVPCNGSVLVDYHHDFYQFAFKTNSASPKDFYFTMTKNYGYDTLPLKIKDARGIVQILDERHVFFDVEYKDSGGQWLKFPLNGRQKINQLWPDDIPKTPNISL